MANDQCPTIYMFLNWFVIKVRRKDFSLIIIGVIFEIKFKHSLKLKWVQQKASLVLAKIKK